MIRSSLAALAMLSIVPAMSLAQTSDPQAGRRVAVESCAACHQVDGGGKSNGSGVSLYAISMMKSTTELSLKVFLQSSHRNMPNFIMSPADIDAVVSYILGLSPR
jgi:mono/diheme cytochrome c family protein